MNDGTSTQDGALRRRRIAAAFGAAVEYDAHSAAQREIAARLARRIELEPLPLAPRVLEIGCGTGHLGRQLVCRLAGASFLFTDLAPEMVARSREAFTASSVRVGFAVMDGETPAVRGPVDLIVSATAFQWFQDLPGSLGRLSALLRPGGLLAFATLGQDTFREWRAAHEELGLESGALRLPSAIELAGTLPAGGLRVAEDWIETNHPDACAFLAELKAIGAGLPRAGHRPLSPAGLRSVLRHLDRQRREPGGLRMTYHVLYGFFRKEK